MSQIKKLIFFVLFFSPISCYALRLNGGGGGGSVVVSSGAASLDPNTTNYIHNQNTLQSGSTFYVSSGTVDQKFEVNGSTTGNKFSHVIIEMGSDTTTPGSSKSRGRIYSYNDGATGSDQTEFYVGVSTYILGRKETPRSFMLFQPGINLIDYQIDGVAVPFWLTNAGAQLGSACNGFLNGGKVTTDSNGTLTCGDDISGSGGGGSSIYAATATASFPFGASLSTITFGASQQATIIYSTTNQRAEISTHTFVNGVLTTSGTSSGMSTVDKGITVNSGGYNTLDAALIVKQSGGAYALNYDPSANVFTSSVPMTVSSTFTVTTSTIVINGATTYWSIARPATNKSFQMDPSGNVTLINAATGDNLGNHVATMTLNMSAFGINNIGSSSTTFNATGQLGIGTTTVADDIDFQYKLGGRAVTVYASTAGIVGSSLTIQSGNGGTGISLASGSPGGPLLLKGGAGGGPGGGGGAGGDVSLTGGTGGGSSSIGPGNGGNVNINSGAGGSGVGWGGADGNGGNIFLNAAGQTVQGGVAGNIYLRPGGNLGPAGATGYTVIGLLPKVSTVDANGSVFATSGTFNGALAVNASLRLSQTTKTANYTMTSTDTIIVASNTAASGSLIITLPAVANNGQSITIVDGARSTGTVLIQAPSGSLIAGVTDQYRLYAPGQSVELVSDGAANWMPNGPLSATPPYLGIEADPNSTAAIVSSTAYCAAMPTSTFLGLTGMRFDVSAAGDIVQIGFYDYNGSVISTSTAALFAGTGSQTLKVVAPGYAAPGYVWACFSGRSITTSITRQSASTPMSGGYCGIANSFPLPTTLTFPGCAVPVSHYSFMTLVGGGVP